MGYPTISMSVRTHTFFDVEASMYLVEGRCFTLDFQQVVALVHS